MTELSVRIKARIQMIVITLVGSLIVFSSVIMMNRYVSRPDKERKTAVVDFTVPLKTKKPAPPPEPKPQRRRSSDADLANLAPLPSLGGSLSGIALNLPDFGAGEGVNDSLLGNLEDVVMTGESVDTPPIPRNLTVPYPDRAKQRETEGQVVVSVRIGVDGRVKNIQILESDPPGLFDQTVLDASANWTFTPAEYQGEPVSAWVNIPIPFLLN